MTQLTELEVHLARDAATGIWFIASSDVPGLRLEAATMHELVRQVEDVAPELVDLNFDEIAASRACAVSRRSIVIRPIIDTPFAIAC